MSHMHFADRLIEAMRAKRSVVCVGLDPRWDQLPEFLRTRVVSEYGRTRRAAAEAFFLFNHDLIEAVAPFAAAVKPQIAFYEQYGPEGLQAYIDTVAWARRCGLLVVGDAKRGDIGSTSEAYAAAHLGISPVDGEPTSSFRVDALTVNPYFGSDGVKPFIETAARSGAGLFVLVKTSNPGSAELQDLHAGIQPIYAHVAERVAEWGRDYMGASGYSFVGAVVGATASEDVQRELRRIMPKSIFLMPGYGAQGVRGNAVAPALNGGTGALVTSSREIMFAYIRDPDAGAERFAEASARAAQAMRDDLNRYIAWDRATSD